MNTLFFIGVAVVLVAIAFVSTLTTGRTPLYWVALVMLYIEAAVWQVLSSIGVACVHFKTEYMSRVKRTRASVSQMPSKGDLVVMPREQELN